jgi:tetratricopeptide (TPR) repeat protein
MLRRARYILLSSTLFTSFCFAQIGIWSTPHRDMPLGSGFASSSGSLQGVVIDALNNKPLQGARVELHDVSNGSVVSSVYTNSAGQFDFGSIPQGIYRVIALQGVSQAEDRVDVSAMGTTVSLRMPAMNRGSAALGGNTVSVAQYKVPEQARTEYVKAAQASDRTKQQEALKHVARALEIYPKYADALTLRAILTLASNTQSAISDLEKAIEADSNYALAYTVLGSAFNSQEKFDQALQTLQRAQTLAPDAWQSYFEMARAYLGKADFQSALRQLDKAQSLLPSDYAPLRLVKAQALMALKQYGAALAECQAYLAKDPNGPNVLVARKMMERAQELSAGK